MVNGDSVKQGRRWGLLRRNFTLMVIVGLATAWSACRETREAATRTTGTKTSAAPEPPTVAEEVTVPEPPPLEAMLPPVPSPAALVIYPIEDWLSVLKVGQSGLGGWARGSFDQDRNKLSIVTSNVERFSLNLDVLRPDWTDRVILGIDGVNSQLQRRVESIIHIARDERGVWHVEEPPAPEAGKN